MPGMAIRSRRTKSMRGKPGSPIEGPQKAAFDDMNARHGLTEHRAYLQPTPDGGSSRWSSPTGPALRASWQTQRRRTTRWSMVHGIGRRGARYGHERPNASDGHAQAVDARRRGGAAASAPLVQLRSTFASTSREARLHASLQRNDDAVRRPRVGASSPAHIRQPAVGPVRARLGRQRSSCACT